MSEQRPGRLPFLDGIRGLAALYVVLHHAACELPDPAGGALGPVLGRVWYHLGETGHYAVSVFIVLSGYSLMLPVLRDAAGWFPGGLRGFAVRRARRVLPAYYAAIALALPLIAAVPALSRATTDPRWEVAAREALAPKVVIAHLLLVHNWYVPALLAIDPPMWSVATEWQIYFLFPPLVLLWRRAGMAATLAAACALGLALTGLLGEGTARINPYGVCPWYLSLFALGMAAAIAPDVRLPWGACAGAFLLLAGLLDRLVVASFYHKVAAIDGVVGLATACLLVHLATGRRASPVLRLAEARGATALGHLSYSLYLTHYPVLVLLWALVRPLPLPGAVQLGFMVLLGVPLCLLAAYPFHLLFERSFLSARGLGAGRALPTPPRA